jgi:hypothetical protein
VLRALWLCVNLTPRVAGSKHHDQQNDEQESSQYHSLLVSGQLVVGGLWSWDFGL